MAGALLFVMPSPHESLSIVTLEAMAQRTPALVSDKSEVLSEHIRKSGGGFLYHDYHAFSTSINNFLSHSSRAKRMATKARNYVVTHYSVDNIRKTLMGVIEAMG